MSDDFRQHVRDGLRSTLIFTSSAYPQGNGVNESAHRILEHAIVCRSAHDLEASLQDIVHDACLAYNASPHPATKETPSFLVTGQDVVLPGFQRLTHYPSGNERHRSLREIRLRALAQHTIREEEFATLKETDVLEENTIALYRLSEYEQQQTIHPTSDSARFRPVYSTPVRIVSVKDNKVLVRSLWNPSSTPLQVNRSQLKILPPCLPTVLHKVAISAIQHELPYLRAQTPQLRQHLMSQEPTEQVLQKLSSPPIRPATKRPRLNTTNASLQEEA